MSNFQNKHKKKSFWHSIPVLFVLGIILFIFAWGIVSFIDTMKDTVKNKKNAEVKVNELQQRKEQLLTDINNLTTDTGKEKIFREDYGLAKEGEGVIIVVDEKKSEDDTVKVKNKGFLGFIKNWFK